LPHWSSHFFGNRLFIHFSTVWFYMQVTRNISCAAVIIESDINKHLNSTQPCWFNIKFSVRRIPS
jgi:hypothetical protein